jgi:hypothetical protein
MHELQRMPRCVIERNDISQLMVRHIEVTAQVLANACHCLDVIDTLAFVLRIRHTLAIFCFVRPLKQELMPVNWAVERHGFLDHRMQVVIVALTLEPPAVVAQDVASGAPR